MKPVKSVSLSIVLRLMVLLLSSSLLSCGSGSYSSAAPGANKREAMAALEAAAAARTTDDTVGYVFSDNVFSTTLCTNLASCKAVLTVGNPVHAYGIDPVSGMPYPKGMPGDSPPENTKSIAVSPTGRFLYMLTGDDLVYTYSVGYSIFAVAEFKEQNLNPLNLYSALSKAVNLTGTALSAEDIVSQLNALLERPDLYAQISASNPSLSETAEIKKLKTATATSRTMLFSDLAESEQKSIIRLNRLMVELAYPSFTPVNKGADAQHAVGTPVAVLPAYYDQYGSFASIELEPLGRFVYVLGRKVMEDVIDPATGVSTPTPKQALSVYARDASSGQLTLSDTQKLSIDQLIFAKSGLFAYGSTNGSLNSYSVNRSTGLLTQVGTPFGFTSWFEGRDFHDSDVYSPFTWQKAPFRNMAADPTGKFLYLIASSGTQTIPPPEGGECSKLFAQLGSLVYTFVVDNDTGKLTLVGPPLDTTPHIITSASVDAQGRFVQLLNTYEYSDGSLVPGGCAGTVTPLNFAAVYSYYVEQATGKLIPSGSVQAGGAQLPTGFVVGGLDSVSLTGDTTGRFLYQLNGGDMYVYSVDQANGALTPIGSPLTGATATAMPGPYFDSSNPSKWPSQCYNNGIKNGDCTFRGSRSHSLTWAGY